ncbi:LysR family transcriptional regulator [Burkholderia gladioli]|uniref:LysR family transcriptional regulator n=1 Tax=Burkholderia gladioli TaxID=28095 RepID=UPI003F798399
MNRLEALRVFRVAASALNFREAATRLGVSPQVITRVIGQLEAELGEPLFHRSTRGVRLSAFGASLAEQAAQAIAGIDRIFETREAGEPEAIEGVVRIAAPGVLGRRWVVRALAPLLAAHAGMAIDVRLSEVVADVVDEQIDVGVRIGPMRDSGLVARAVSSASLHFAAAPSLVERCLPHDRPSLLAAPAVLMIDRNSGRPWPWMFADGQHAMPARAVLTTDDPEAECEAVLSGIGIGQLPGHLALPHLREGRLVPLLEGLRPAPSTIYVYRTRRLPVPPRVRIVYDALCEALDACEGPVPLPAG